MLKSTWWIRCENRYLCYYFLYIIVWLWVREVGWRRTDRNIQPPSVTFIFFQVFARILFLKPSSLNPWTRSLLILVTRFLVIVFRMLLPMDGGMFMKKSSGLLGCLSQRPGGPTKFHHLKKEAYQRGDDWKRGEGRGGGAASMSPWWTDWLVE